MQDGVLTIFWSPTGLPVRCQDAQILNEVTGSDHCPVALILKD